MRKITFFTNIPGMAELHPIYEAKDYKPDWVEGARKIYLEKLKKNGNRSFTDVYRCPGIFDLMSTGYIVPLPWDIIIETNGDGENFKWTITSEFLAEQYGGTLVSGHMANDIAAPFPPRPGCLRSIIKFNTPWHIIAPPGVKFIAIPIPYGDDFDFEHNMGLLDPSISTEINPQVWWKKLKGERLIKAGTPMLQLVPLTDEKFELEVVLGDMKAFSWMKKRDYFFNMSFQFKRKVMQAMYLQHWFGKK
jgi:hypothetical protein